MRLTKLKIENYRLLLNSELIVDEKTTLIVGRNNTGKTSCNDLVNNVIKGKALDYDDYPLVKREVLQGLLYKFMKREISYSELKKELPVTSLEFWVDYSLDAPEDNLGALSPFIIDVDESITEAIVRVEYSLKKDEGRLRKILIPYFYDGDNFIAENSDMHDAIAGNFQKIFEMVIYAVNPLNMGERQVKSVKELGELFPFYSIPAERELGGDGTQKKSSLGKLITSYFDVKEEDLDPSIAKEMIELRTVVEKANSDVQKKSDELLGSVVNKAIGFGYPNGEELQLAVNTKLQIDDQIKNQTELAYTSDFQNETLPSSHNGLGYLNLIKMEFLLAAYAKEIENQSESCIPLVFIEEPESHMHPQMQRNFADYLETFLRKISNVHIQTFVTTHSSHIANTIDFSKIRYAKRTNDGVIFKNLKLFVDSEEADIDFIKKYLTLSRCDLFFADKVIFVEGASERLLIPDMISKCEAEGLFKPQKYNLSAQYYALIEIGGAYAKEFIPFVKFLDIPCLILTDIDSVGDNQKKCVVGKGKTSSNATIKWWVRKVKGKKREEKVTLEEIISLAEEQKTYGKCHIEFQVKENGLCGRSLEEAIRNVNRTHFELETEITEENLSFTGKCKTDFALDLISKYPNYAVPQYIKDGLVWLNNQTVCV